MPISHLIRAMALVLACAAPLAHAGLLGTTVINSCANSVYAGTVTTDTAQCDFGTTQASPGSAVVGAGAEFQLGGTRFFDFADQTLTITYIQPVSSASPDLVIFELADLISQISLVGTNALNVSWAFSGKALGILVSDPLVDGTVTLRFGPDGQVPEPGTLALTGLALLGLAQARRRRRA